MPPDQPSTPAAGTPTGPTAGWSVRLRGVRVAYGGRKQAVALDGVDLTLTPGQSIALLGPNGSGKSTLLGVLAGLVRPSEGSVEVVGRPRLGMVFQSPALDPLLTVVENLRLQAALHGQPADGRSIADLCAAHGLGDRLSSRVRTLSGGLARRVEFVRAILCEPDLLLLDEATVGLDLPSRRRLLDAVDGLRQRHPGLGVVMSTHLLTDAERADRVVLMADGKIAQAGTAEELTGALGGLVVVAPAWAADAARAVALPWEDQADGTLAWRPQDQAELEAWVGRLAGGGVPFSVRRPTLADAYLAHAGGSLGAGA